jgi:hypothetical protein
MIGRDIANNNFKKQQNVIITYPNVFNLISSQLINELIKCGLFHWEIDKLIVLYKMIFSNKLGFILETFFSYISVKPSLIVISKPVLIIFKKCICTKLECLLVESFFSG